MKRQTRSSRSLVAFVAALLMAAGLLVAQPTQPAAALSGASFDPGNIISDAYFYDGNAMSAAEIQAFLNARIGTCSDSNCLNVLRVATSDKPARYTDAGVLVCGGYTGAASESAAEIIFKVQRACSVSAKVILVTLQKEQGLVTKRSVSDGVLERAMGYGCPDHTGGVCAAQYYGFFNQVYSAVWQLKRYGTRVPWGTYQPGWNTIQWHPNADCGAAQVNIRNNATAALYNYTPYQPNQSALSNLRGTGDACASYGNRNFWVYYNDWFGSPTLPAGTPVGEIKDLWVGTNTISMWGWALDLDSKTSPIAIHIKVDDWWVAWSANANNASTEVLYPGSGTNHGFGGVLSVTPGPHTVCVYGVNVGAGVNLPLTCRDLVVPDGSPSGELKELWTSANAISLWGWAADPDALDKNVAIHIVANGRWFVMQADQPYAAGPDLLAGAGARTAFGGTIPVPAGRTDVCVYAVNLLQGANTELGCRTVMVSDGSPVGSLMGAWGTPGGISAWGWAAEIDAVQSSVDIDIRVDTSWFVMPANQNYPPAAALAPGGGQDHGWGGTVPAAPGVHQVCAWAVNTGVGSTPLLGCRTVTVPGGSPVGRVAEVWGQAGGIGMWGWALDPDTADSIAVHVLVDGAWSVLHADAPNASVGTQYRLYGANHGFGAVIPAAPGTHSVCVYAVNVGEGANTTLSCREVSVP